MAPPRYKHRPRRCLILLIGLTLPFFTSAEGHGQGNYTNLSQAFWQLADLTTYPVLLGKQGNPLMGYQNYTHCCLLAVNQSLEIVNGYIVEKSPSFVDSTVDELLTATANGQFPCGAVWNGDHKGAPEVAVPASWIAETCPGWQLSDTDKGDESQFELPFFGFIIPAACFCFTIPRRRKLALPGKLFVPDLSQSWSWVLAPVAMVVAAVPMLLSGFYEAFLDNRVISFLETRTINKRLTLDMRGRLLFVVPVGNLDIEPEPQALDLELVAINNLNRDDDDRWPNENDHSFRNPSSPWTHIENLVYPLRTYGDSAVGTPRQWPLHNVQCTQEDCVDLNCMERPLSRSEADHPEFRKEVGRTKTRARTMLACQYSFGATVGAPIIFFQGAFLFTLLSTLSNLGDKDTSLALAFGMWYMITPHVSIVSGFLLAGNNPNILEGVVALEYDEEADSDSDTDPTNKQAIGWRNLDTIIFEQAYESRYWPQWLWLRGRSKRLWIERVWQIYRYRPGLERDSIVEDDDMLALKATTTLSVANWAVVVFMTSLLMDIPFLLAFLTAFYTPEIGVSCRSLTFTVYAIAQTCYIFLWLWAFAGAPYEGPNLRFLRQGGFLDTHGFYNPTSLESFKTWSTFWTWPTLWALIWYNLATVFGIAGIFTAIGGTMMQLMGVYNNGTCEISALWWRRPHGNVMITISTNYALAIHYADTYWKACAITATLFLGVVSFGGWWYQRRLRGLFRRLVKEIGDERREREGILMPRRRGGRGQGP